MNQIKSISAALALACLVSGCWTFCKSEYPRVAATAAPASATNLVIAVNGFEAVVSDYAVMNGYTAVYVPGYYGYHHYHPGYYGMQPTFATYRRNRTTDMFLRRARSMFDDAGFSMASTAAVPNYTVEVSFAGPVNDSSDMAKTVCWLLCTVFFCDYDATAWTATLRIRDNATGKVIFKHDYVQRYETNVAGVIPIFSVGACEEISYDYEQGWCLAALTDRAVADATAFLAAR